MNAYASFGRSVNELVAYAVNGDTEMESDIRAALDGAASRELRRLIRVAHLRESGAFFTGTDLAEFAWATARDTLTRSSVVVDPACGAGALLLPIVSELLALAEGDVSHVADQIRGVDIHTQFVNVTRARLRLQAAVSGRGKQLLSHLPTGLFRHVRAGDSLLNMAGVVKEATHVILNPPYNNRLAPKGCSWSSGSVNSAALFTIEALRSMQSGAHLVAILPDVLRSGTRYERWRSELETLGSVQAVKEWGQFDLATDVHVFTLHMIAGRPERLETCSKIYPTGQLPKSTTGRTVGDLFNVTVGAVVPHRHQLTGPLRAFATARDLPARKVVKRLPKRRRFAGTCHQPPFVLVRRTSRPGESPRARGTIVLGKRPVAVDNHLLILLPRDASLEACHELLQVLQSQAASDWLDGRFRCRHIPAQALRLLPWRVNDDDD
jgi:hypothetical protein